MDTSVLLFGFIHGCCLHCWNSCRKRKSCEVATSHIFNEYWFVTTYIGLLLIAPFLSILATSLTKRNYHLLAVLFLICFQFLYGRVFAGFSTITWFSFLYLVAGYIKLFDVPEILKKKIFAVVIGVWMLLVLMATFYNLMTEEFKLVSSAYDGPMFFLSTAIFIFVLQRSFDNRFGLLIAKLASYTFGVYLIHENPFVRDWLWNSVIPEQYECPIILHCILVCTVVFIMCVLIDYFRQKLFNLLGINRFVKCLSSKLPCIN